MDAALKYRQTLEMVQENLRMLRMGLDGALKEIELLDAIISEVLAVAQQSSDSRIVFPQSLTRKEVIS